MSDNIKVGIEVSDNGTTNKVTKNVKDLKGMLDQTADSAVKTSKAIQGASALAGPTPSSRFARSAAARPTGMAGETAGIGGLELEEYNRAAGTAGRAGGSARDFADQSRGLGGLVRLYATFAANIFAATAAFTALSNAMDTANMVRGLDQLGAASGVALGSLSKRLVTTTDGAISLREAMEATVKASSAGLNTDQILKLGNVAKSASSALGLNMPDALSRLTRGISKLEPELLDELGIFVKIDDAVSKYALSVGKSASSLTDFERRQAFANAVLDQGAKKFGDIKIDSNPYTKLAATLKDLSFTVLEFVNKGLTPFVKILADNSQILGLIIGTIALKLLKTAIPAFGEFGSGIVRAADEASKSAKRINTAFGEAFVERWNTKLRIPELEKEVQKIDTLLKQAGTAGIQKGERGFTAATRISTGQGTTKDFAIINNLIKERTELYQKEIEASGGRETAAARGLKREIDGYNNLIALNKSYTSTSKELADARAKFSTEAIEKEATFSERTRQRIVDAANSRAIALRALSEVSANTMEMGFSGALQKLNRDLDNNVGKVRRYVTLTVGAVAAATTAIGLFVSSLQMWLNVALFVVTAAAGILSWLSNTKKEAQLTSEAFDRLEGATKNSFEVLERISKLDPLERISVENIQARATAFKEIGDSLVLGVSRAFNQLEKMNWAAKTIDFFKGIFNADVRTKLAENITDSIVQGFKLARPSEATKTTRDLIEKILGVGIDSPNLGIAVEKLIKSGNKQAIAELAKAIETLGNQSAVSAAKTTELKNSITNLTTRRQEFIKSFALSDNLSKFALDATESAKKLSIALQDPTQSLNAMRLTVNNIDLLSIFPSEISNNLINYSKQLDNIALRLENLQELAPGVKQEIKILEDELAYLQSPQARTAKGVKEGEGRKTEGSRQAERALQEQIDQTRKKLDELKNEPIKLMAKIELNELEPIKREFNTAIRESLLLSADMMASRLAAEMAKTGLIVSNALAGLLGDSQAGIKLRAENEKQLIIANQEQTRQTLNLAIKMEELKLGIEKKRLQEEKSDLLRQQFLAAERKGPDAEKIIKDLGEKIKGIDLRFTDIQKLETMLASRGTKAPTARSIMGEITDTTPQEQVRSITERAGIAQMFEGARLQLAQAEQQIIAVELKKANDLLKAQQKIDSDIARSKLEQLDVGLQNLDILKNSNSISDQAYINQKEQLSLARITQEFDNKQLEINQKQILLWTAGSETLKRGLETGNQRLQILGREAMIEANNIALRESGILSSQRLTAIEKEKAQTAEARRNILKQEQENNLKLIDFDLQRLEIFKNLNSISDLEYVNTKELLTLKKINQEFTAKELELNDKLNRSIEAGQNLYDEGVQTSNEVLRQRGEELVRSARIQHVRDRTLLVDEKSLAIDRAKADAQISRTDAVQKELDIKEKIQRLEAKTTLEIQETKTSTALELLSLELEYRRTQGTLTDEQFRKEENLLKLRQLEATRVQSLAKLNQEASERLADLERESGQTTSPERYMAIAREQVLVRSRLQAETDGVNRLTDARIKQLELEGTISTRQRAYADIFERSMDNMTDAIMEFTKTGKLSFKSLIDTMIAELIRFEIRRMMTASFGTGSSIFSAIASMFTGGLSTGQYGVAPIGSSGYGGQGYIGGGAAKGAYFNGMSSNWAPGAVEKFAMGGAFTNQIVDSPTLFKFARGTGLMGEAGPEAIMPLKRDPQGNLGVRGSGSNVEVVVNNYSQEQATTRETTDSRGNRRIEVMIGDVVAGEMTRTGSNSQRAVRGTFGLQPQLIRR